MRILIAAAAVLVAWTADTAADPRPADPRAQLAPLAQSLIDREYCAGIVIGVIPADRPPQVMAWGETVRGNHKLPDGNTVFEIGSVSKLFTSLLLAEAVIARQVALDAPLASLLPPSVKLPAGKRPITLLDLATHTSGLPRLPDNLHPADIANPYADYTVDQLYAFLAGATLDAEPGSKFVYSNLGAGLLGHALALRAKSPWGAMVVAQIARPLGMTSTVVTLTPELQARFAQGYDSDGEPAKPWDLPALAGAGALRSTATDLIAFVRAELAAARAPRGALAQAMALSQKPQRDADPEPAKGKIGLAWHIEPDGTLWHNGATGGYHAFVALRPKGQIGVVVLASGAAQQVDELGNAALNAAAGEPVPPALKLPPPDRAVDDRTLESYAGSYSLGPGFAVAISRTGSHLYLQATGKPRLRLHATSARDFVVRVAPASVTFEVDAQGKVTGLVLHQGGKDLRAPRQ